MVGDLDWWAVQLTVAGVGSAQEGHEWLRHSDLVSQLWAAIVTVVLSQYCASVYRRYNLTVVFRFF